MDLDRRARRYAALGDPARLAIVEELLHSDRSPSELGDRFDIPSNLLAHHLAVLEKAGLVIRIPSGGDARRRYIRADHRASAELGLASNPPADPVVFVCTHNSARSQLAAAQWTRATGETADSAGTHPADRVRPGAVAAARRAGLDLEDAVPRSIADIDLTRRRVITVCDRAHEVLEAGPDWWHWSVPDPVDLDTPEAYDAARDQIADRIAAITRGHPWN
jgi:protein-tyrosine-phosphatase